jgi:hypothetical protein
MGYYLKGRLAIFSWMAYETYSDVTEKEGDWFWDAFHITQFTLGSVFLFMPEIRFVGPKVAEGGLNAAGRLALAAARTPVGTGVIGAAVIYAGGVAVSSRIDEEHGVENFIGFTTGGVYGESDIHYLTGDAMDSGYFNVPKNISIIGEHYYSEGKSWASKKREELREDAMRWWIGPKPFGL